MFCGHLNKEAGSALNNMWADEEIEGIGGWRVLALEPSGVAA